MIREMLGWEVYMSFIHRLDKIQWCSLVEA